MTGSDGEKHMHRGPHHGDSGGDRSVGLAPHDDLLEGILGFPRRGSAALSRLTGVFRTFHTGLPLRISRAAFSTAYFESGKLTILTEGGHQAYQGGVEGKKDEVAAAFTSRGYRWGEI